MHIHTVHLSQITKRAPVMLTGPPVIRQSAVSVPQPTHFCRACGHNGHHARGLCLRCYGVARSMIASGVPWVIAMRRVRARFAPPLADDGLPSDFPYSAAVVREWVSA